MRREQAGLQAYRWRRRGRAAGAHGQLRPGQRRRQVAQREQAAVREAAVARGLQVLLCLSPVLLARAVCIQ